jgi:hypothetical protein
MLMPNARKTAQTDERPKIQDKYAHRLLNWEGWTTDPDAEGRVYEVVLTRDAFDGLGRPVVDGWSCSCGEREERETIPYLARAKASSHYEMHQGRIDG